MSGTTSAVPLPLPVKTPVARKRGPLVPLRIDTPTQNESIAVTLADHSSTSSLSSANSEASVSDLLPFAVPSTTKPKSLRNMKKLSLALPSAASSSASLALPPSEPATSASTASASDTASIPPFSRRPSVASLTTASATAALAHRKEEDGGSPSVPYANGPVEIIPGIWIGSEDNAREFDELARRGIRAILNVAKEVTSAFDPLPEADTGSPRPSPPANVHYLKMDWSHGQSDLIKDGFPAAMAFVDAARERGDGVLIHCQCGISRSGTMVIALVMRAAAESHASVPPEVWKLKGMHAAYAYVKQKSRWVGPNMSLIYQLLEYERVLRRDSGSPTPSERSCGGASDEDEWSRQRQALDDAPTDDEDRESLAVRREAEALDQAMVDRRVARKASSSSFASSASSSGGIGMGTAWKTRYGGRRRAGSHVSVASSRTTGSVLSEDLMEEDEEEEPASSTYDGTSTESNSPYSDLEETPRVSHLLPNRMSVTPKTARALSTPRTAVPPPSAPAHRTSFIIPPPPLTAVRATFDLPSEQTPKPKRRPAPLVSLLPPVPASPRDAVTIVEQAPAPESHVEATPKPAPASSPMLNALPRRVRTQSTRPTPPPAMLRSLSNTIVPVARPQQPPSSGPSQTLFVFPPSPNNSSTRTPSTMTLLSSAPGEGVPFPCVSPPRVATEKKHGRTRSFVALGVPPTPTTACSRVDVRGFFGGDA